MGHHGQIYKICPFVGLPSKFSAPILAARFSVEICRLYGMPQSIVSDRDRLFLRKFWRTLFKHQGMALQYSSAYHPQFDGQTQVVNRTLVAYLRCFIADFPHKWFLFFHLAEQWYNSAKHSVLQMSPYQALYGHSPPSIADYDVHNTTLPNVHCSQQQRKFIIKTVRENLNHSRQYMKGSSRYPSHCHFFRRR